MIKEAKIDLGVPCERLRRRRYPRRDGSGRLRPAVAFYEDHPDETLIVVTGDHETGGLTIGCAETNYDTFPTNIAQQKISYAKFDSDYVAGYIEAGATYDQAMEDVAQLFGLSAGCALSPGAEAAAQVAEAEPGSLMLTVYEDERLQGGSRENRGRRRRRPGGHDPGGIRPLRHLRFPLP